MAALSLIDVDQFYGIELGEFPVRIAEVALFMMDHLMNNRLSLTFGQNYARIPLSKSPHIVYGDALAVDWNEVLAASACGYVLGNPPFIGSKYQTVQQREQVRNIAQLGKSGGTLDYVAAWFIKAGCYVSQGEACIGFVATNSITQGEQVAQLWTVLFTRYKLEIAFAHRTFAWGSDARGKAHVHVVIIGLSRSDSEPNNKRLFTYDDINGEPTESNHRALTPYLFDGSTVTDRHLVVKELAQPLSDVPALISGTQPIDDGNYTFDAASRDQLIAAEPIANKYLHPYVGAEEYLHAKKRWILNLQQASPSDLKAMPSVVRRMQNVKTFRSLSKRSSTLQIANYPEVFNVTVIPNSPFLVLPKVSSERREYVPIGWLEPPTIPSDLVFVLRLADLWHFAILTSRLHMVWLRYIGGRLESRYRYSIGLVYNTFPWVEATDKQKEKIRTLGQKILDIRAKYPDEKLADLYDPNLMKADLRKAHQKLDTAVELLYRPTPFDSDRDRVEHLFKLYEERVTPLLAMIEQPSKRGRKKGK